MASNEVQKIVDILGQDELPLGDSINPPVFATTELARLFPDLVKQLTELDFQRLAHAVHQEAITYHKSTTSITEEDNADDIVSDAQQIGIIVTLFWNGLLNEPEQLRQVLQKRIERNALTQVQKARDIQDKIGELAQIMTPEQRVQLRAAGILFFEFLQRIVEQEQQN
jgi:hypothetical protein